MWIPARQRWPNTGSDSVGEPPRGCFSSLSFFLTARFLLPLCLRQRGTHVLAVCTHQTDAADTALGDGALAHFRRLLPEEEIQLVVVPLGAVGDEVHVDERGVWRRGGRRVRQDDERLFQSSEDLHLVGPSGPNLVQKLPAFPVYRWLNLYIKATCLQSGFEEAGTVTVQPSGVVLVRPHGRLAPQRAEDGRVGSHEVHVDAGVQLAV